MHNTSDSRLDMRSVTCVVCAMCGVDMGMVVCSLIGYAGVSLITLVSFRFKGRLRRFTLKRSVGVSLRP